MNGISLVEPLGPATDSYFRTEELIGYYYNGNTKINIYGPIDESEGDGSPAFGIAALRRVIEEQAWRDDSIRIIYALMDSHFKEGPNPSLDRADLVGAYLGGGPFVFSGMIGPGPCCGGIDPRGFSDASGGTIQSMPLNSFASELPDSLAAHVPSEFSQVMMIDDGTAAEGIGVDIQCTISAPGGVCADGIANGSFLRDETKAFEFDVTFDALKEGTWLVKLDLMIDDRVTRQKTVTVYVSPAEVIHMDGFEGSPLH